MFSKAAIDRVGHACLRRAAWSLRPAIRPLRSFAQVLAAPLRCKRGTALVEFALVGPPFLLLLAGILEISVMFFASSVIEGATKEAARQIRTGQIQGSADPLTTFRNELCDALYNVIDCSKVTFNVQTFSSFETVSMPLELDEDGEIINTTFAPGSSGAVTVVRSMYRWRFATPIIADVIPAALGGHLLVSTVAFQNEPYSVN